MVLLGFRGRNTIIFLVFKFTFSIIYSAHFLEYAEGIKSPPPFQFPTERQTL